MNRRQFLQATVGSALAASVIPEALSAQLMPSTIPAGSTQPRKLILDAYSRYLHWLRSPDEVAEAVIELTCGGLMPTVGAYPSHIDLTKVTQELPAFVKRIQSHGLRVSQLRGPGATDPGEPNVEALIASAAQAGVKSYWLGTDRYDMTKPIYPQLDALKFRVEKFVKLNEKHKITLLYHTRSGRDSIGGTVFDLLSVLKNFDPKYVALHWDPVHMSHLETGMWEPAMRATGPYLAAIAWKDNTVEKAGRGAQPAAARGAAARGAAAPAEAAQGRGNRGGQAPTAQANSAGETLSWPNAPIGTGVVDFQRVIAVLRDLGFNGPMELEAEYTTLGGANSGADKLTISRAELMAALKRDIAAIRSAFEISKSGMTVA